MKTLLVVIAITYATGSDNNVAYVRGVPISVDMSVEDCTAQVAEPINRSKDVVDTELWAVCVAVPTN